jgi:N utilization substance protein A
VRLASKLIGWQIDIKSEEQKKQEVLSVMESLTSSSTPLGELEGISDRIIEKLREAGIENVERILELGESELQEIPGVGEKTAAKIMEAARDLFEEVEIEVPEGMELPTAIEAPGAQPPGQTDEAAPTAAAEGTDVEAAKAEPAAAAAEETPSPAEPGESEHGGDSDTKED